MGLLSKLFGKKDKELSKEELNAKLEEMKSLREEISEKEKRYKELKDEVAPTLRAKKKASKGHKGISKNYPDMDIDALLDEGDCMDDLMMLIILLEAADMLYEDPDMYVEEPAVTTGELLDSCVEAASDSDPSPSSYGGGDSGYSSYGGGSSYDSGGDSSFDSGGGSFD